MTLYPIWVENSEKGKRLLADLGNETAQQNILGDDYQWIHGTLSGRCEPPIGTNVSPGPIDIALEVLGGVSGPLHDGVQKRFSDGADAIASQPNKKARRGS